MVSRVMLVDDDLGVINALRRELMRPPDIGFGGLEIDSFLSPGEALDWLRESPDGPDIVISDYMMPGLDGVSFLQEVHALVPDAIRIMLTGCSDVDMAIGAVNAAKIDYLLTKPWHEYDLKGRMAQALSRLDAARQRTAPPANPEIQASQRQPAPPYQILLAGDDPEVLKALKRDITRGEASMAGGKPMYQVRICSSPVTALLSAMRTPADLVIADFALSEVAITFFHRLRNACPDTVRVLLSGHVSTKGLLEAINVAGIYHFLPKPWRTSELKMTLMQALVRYHLAAR